MMLSEQQKQRNVYHWNRLARDPQGLLLSAIHWAVSPALALNGTRKETVLTLAAALGEVAELLDEEVARDGLVRPVVTPQKADEVWSEEWRWPVKPQRKAR